MIKNFKSKKFKIKWTNLRYTLLLKVKYIIFTKLNKILIICAKYTLINKASQNRAKLFYNTKVFKVSVLNK